MTDHMNDAPDRCPLCFSDLDRMRAAFEAARDAARRMRRATLFLLFAGGLNVGVAAYSIAVRLTSG